MHLKYLGQTGFLISLEEGNFLIDPYLSNYVVSSGIGDARYFSRQYPPPVSIEELKNIRAILITHDHADHCDPETVLPILSNNPDCRVIAPEPAHEILVKKGMDGSRCLTPSLTNWQSVGTIQFIALPSAHYELDQDTKTGAYPYLGFVIKHRDVILYHAGDTILYDGMVERLKKISKDYDVCCLPANGRDANREALGIIGNLQPQEALWLVDQIHANTLIPTHNDLFKSNQIDPSILTNIQKAQYPAQTVKWLRAGEELIL